MSAAVGDGMEQGSGALAETGRGAAPAPTEPFAAQWARVRGRLQAEVGEVEWRTWLRQMTLAGLDGDEITILLPTRFLRDWVRSHYADRLQGLWQAENRRVRRVDVRVGDGAAGAAPASSESLDAGLRPDSVRADSARADMAAFVMGVGDLVGMGEQPGFLVEHQGVRLPAIPQRAAGFDNFVGAVIALFFCG